jgi:hypothetical protein
MCMGFCSMAHTESEHSRFRRFFTKEEHIQQMEKYAEELKNELKAVDEHINELKEKK